jgi:alkylhydroperoxidase/carboxymuconolactone decarboxylase family protein YurZ
MSKTRTLAEFEQRYQDMIGHTPPKIAKRLKLGMAVDPDLVAALEDWRIAALTPDALDAKTVQLICFAVLLAQTSEAAANHARAAVKAGATVEELHATAGLAALFRGVAAFNLAGEMIAGLFPDKA